jgi:hypothetical protein
MTGEPLEPRLSTIAARMHHGDYADSQLDAMNTILTKLPPHVNLEQREAAEKSLVAFAKDNPARVLHEVGRRIHAYLDPDGPAPTDKEDANPRRELHLHTGTDGRLSFRGSFDAETGSLFSEILSPLSKPRPSDKGERDPRTTTERQGDALADILGLVADTGDLPIQGQERPHITLTIPWELLMDKIGTATTSAGAIISPEAARRIACDAKILPMILDSDSLPLNVKREERLVPLHIRKALNERDKGCAFHNCTRPPRWAKAHHIRHWADGGETSLENCVLLCDYHHRMIHHGDWTVQMTNGHPEFVPPTYYDPQRRPLRNTFRQTH